MRYLVLTASAGVSDDLAERARRLIDGDTPNRLSECAVEIAHSGAVPDNLLGDEPVDTNIVLAENRRKKLLIADMDSTMILRSEARRVGKEGRSRWAANSQKKKYHIKSHIIFNFQHLYA